MSATATERRDALVAAAQRVIVRAGFDGATVGEITREAGASLGLLNYHFGSKDAVVAEAFAALARGQVDAMESIAARPAPALERLAAFVAASRFGEAESWSVWVGAWGSGVRAEPLRATLEAFVLDWRAALARILADGVREGAWACADPDALAARLVAAADGIGTHALLHPGFAAPGVATGWLRRLASLELGVAIPARDPRGVADRDPVADAQPPHAHRVQLRARDLDAAGRVHHAVWLSCLEEARGGLLAALVPPPASAVVSEVALRVLRPVDGKEGAVLATCALAQAGERRLRTREAIVLESGALVATATASLSLQAVAS